MMNQTRMEQRINWLQQEVEHLEEKLKEFPQGELVAYPNGAYYKLFHKQDGERHPLKSEDRLARQLFAKALVQRQYEDRALEFKMLQAFARKREKVERDWAHKVARESEGLARVLKVERPKSPQEEWLSEEYEVNPVNPDQRNIKVPGVGMVRSKSEYIIAKTLRDEKIPFRYECRQIIGGKIYYPDFTILHPETNEIYLWEHFGLMGDSRYRRNAFDKMAWFAKNGYFYNDHFIMTFEDQDHPLDSARVQHEIQDHFRT